MKSTFTRTFILVLLIGLALAACTRSVNPTSIPPTSAPNGEGGGGETDVAPDSEIATMNAVSTSVAEKTTATAQAKGNTTENVPPATPTPEPAQTTPEPSGVITPTAEAAVATPVPATPAPAVGAACPNPYTVKDGDWIYKIARDCKVEPSALIAANPGINPNRIAPGQQLVMPGAGATAVPPATPQAQACTGSYTVKNGDNLFRIAYNCGLTTEQLAAANGIRFPYTIYPGQVVKFP